MRLASPGCVWLIGCAITTLLGCKPGSPARPDTGRAEPDQSVLTRNNHNSRDGFFTQPALTKAAAARMARDTGFGAVFAGSMRASPLYFQDGPKGNGIFIAAATNNTVYALDETSGAIIWMHSIGEAPAQTGAGCGEIHPIGVISTPVIDAAARTIYVAGGVGPGDIQRHEIHALSVDDGTELTGWPVNVSGLTGPGGLVFETKAQNQRSALSLVGGTLYVAYGGHAGDCGPYRGWVIAVNTGNPAQTGAWATAGRGEGIWASGGMASDGNGVFAVTGNRIGDSPTHQDSEEVVRVAGMGNVDRTTGIFYPANWRSLDQGDQDFGASSPVILQVPEATPSTVLVAATKLGGVYLLDPTNLGGLNGNFGSLSVGGGNSIKSALGAYMSSTGAHVILNLRADAPCGGGKGVLSLLVARNAVGVSPGLRLAWCAPTTGDSSAIATSTDGTNDTVVWYMDGDKLTGVDGDTGAPIYVDASTPCAGIPQWSSPIAVKGRIVAGGDGHLCSWSPH